MTIITVPARIVGYLRDSLHTELAIAAEDIGQVSDEGGRRRPELYAEPINRLDCARALLDLIGWKEASSSGSVAIKTAAHRDTVLAALKGRLEAERYLMTDDPRFDGAARQIRNAKRRAREIEHFLVDAGVTPSRSE